jgi:hypothetical protein
LVAGKTFVDPIARWLSTRPGMLEVGNGVRRIGGADVVGIERSAQYFAATDAEVGGGLSREAAVGQLKYAVDLLKHSSYDEDVGNQLLAAIAELAGKAGWMCHDSNMPGPAQRYLVYGLQAACESTHERAPLLAVSALVDLGRLMRWSGQRDTALRLFNLALDRIPTNASGFNSVKAILWGNRAWELASLGGSCMPEARNALDLAAELQAEATDEDRLLAGPLMHLLPAPDAADAEVASTTSAAYLVLAAQNRRLAGEAEKRTLHAIARQVNGSRRNNVLNQIRLARVRFVAGEPEQACDDGDTALMVTGEMVSSMVTVRLRELLNDSESYRELPRVQEFQERLQIALTG